MMTILLLLICSFIVRLCDSFLSKHNINDMVYDNTLQSSLFLKSLLTKSTLTKNKNNNKLSYITNRQLQKKLYLSHISDSLSMELLSSTSSSQLHLSQEEVISTVTNYIPPEVTSEIWLDIMILVLTIVLVKVIIIYGIIIIILITITIYTIKGWNCRIARPYCLGNH